MKKPVPKFLLAVLLVVPLGLSAQMSDLIISEYGEGAGNNDYLEIYNGTGADVDLSQYYLWKIINAGNWYARDYHLDGILPHGQTLNIVKYSADSALLIHVDTTGPVQGVDGSTFTFMVSNGNEAFALAKVLGPGDTVIIDKVGEESGDVEPLPWDVAGVTGATKEHTLVRKPTVSGPNADWAASAGTDAENSEWIVHPHNYWKNLGFHSEFNSAPASDLFFSEYGDLGGNDYLEIYNGTHADIDLTQYFLWKIVNAGNWRARDFQLEGIIPPGKAFTVISYKADSLLLIKQDTLGPVIGVGGSDFTFMVTNGNEAFAIAKVLAPGDTVIIDKIGEESGDVAPDSWDVAGVVGAAKDHTLIRKSTVGGPNTDWAGSAGTSEENSEWIIYPGGYWKNVTKHSMYLGSITPTVDVTFAVDLNQETVAANGVHLTGNFQSWDPAATLMDDTDGDGIYTVTVSLEVNQTYEYKFVNGDQLGQVETVPAECAQNSNRSVQVAESDVVLDTVCFGSCTACAGMYNVTFSVDMSEQMVSGDGVHLAGDFQGWDPAATLMDDGDADGIWEVTMELGGNTSYQYKYINGSMWGFDEIVPAACAVDGYRSLSLGISDLVIDVVCFGSCTACATGIEDLEREQNFSIYPNPSAGQFEVTLDQKAAGKVMIQVYSVTGQLILSREPMLPAGPSKEVFALAEKGIYFVEISSGQGHALRKLVIQ